MLDRALPAGSQYRESYSCASTRLRRSSNADRFSFAQVWVTDDTRSPYYRRDCPPSLQSRGHRDDTYVIGILAVFGRDALSGVSLVKAPGDLVLEERGSARRVDAERFALNRTYSRKGTTLETEASHG